MRGKTDGDSHRHADDNTWGAQVSAAHEALAHLRHASDDVAQAVAILERAGLTAHAADVRQAWAVLKRLDRALTNEGRVTR